MIGKKHEKSRWGFTFVETILAIVVVGVIAGVAAKVLIAGLDIYALIVNRNNAYQSARVAMDRMVDELTMIHSGDISWVGEQRINFRNTEGQLTSFRKSSYNPASQPGQTIPCIFMGNDFLVGEVAVLDFDYYALDGSVTTRESNIRRINIDMTVTSLAGGGSVHLRTDVFPRNFMYQDFE